MESPSSGAGLEIGEDGVGTCEKLINSPKKKRLFIIIKINH
jgi:hypothetical protein